MKIRRFFGKDMREALKLVKDELGGDAVIMSNKKVANGVELVAAIDPVSNSVTSHNTSQNTSQNISQNTPHNSSHGRMQNNTQTAMRNHNMQGSGASAGDESSGHKRQFNQSQPGSSHTPPAQSLRDIIGDSGPDSLQALLEQQESSRGQPRQVTHSFNHQQSQSAQHKSLDSNASASLRPTNTNQAGTQNHAAERSSAHNGLHYSQQPNYGNMPDARADERIFRSPAFTQSDAPDMTDTSTKTQAAGINAASAPPPSVLEPAQLDIIRAELESIKNVLTFQVSGLSEERKKRNNPVHHYLHEQLTKMGVSQDLSRQFVEFLPYQIDEKQGWKYILNLLSNRLHVGGNDILNQCGVVALVGPTGTGKTTTVAKLAAKYAQKYGPGHVALITIDTYRIAAFEQLATYGKIIGCAVKKAHSSQELNDILYQMRNKKLVLIDTAGFSQRDARLIDQLTQYEHKVNVHIRKYLVLPAGSQYQVLNQTVKAYKTTNISGCIFTKLDECYSMGEALSVIIENDLSLSYVTDGQRVPEDIKLADSANLTLIAAKLFKRYGNGDPVALSTHTGGI